MARPKRKRNEPELFHVEVITKARVAFPSSDDENEQDQEAQSSNDRWEYYVKWGNYDSDSNTWEPARGLRRCQRLLASFWDHIGIDDGDHEPGYEVAADDQWIGEEKRFFQETYRDELGKDRNRRRKTTKKKTAGGKVSRRSINAKSQMTNSLSGVDSDDDGPLFLKIRHKLPLPPENESSDEAPPRKTMKTNSARTVVTDPPREKEVIVEDQALLSTLSSEPEQAQSALVLLPPLQVPTVAQPLAALQQTTPFVKKGKNVDLNREQNASGSGLSTKHRLSMGALAPRLPKAMPPPLSKPTSQLPPLRNAPPSLMHLSFKQKNIPTPIISAGLGPSFSSDSPSYIAPPTYGDEPTLTTINSSPSPNQSPPNEAEMPYELTSGLLLNDVQVEANDFLRGIMPLELAGPLKYSV
ncbi:hypothetical protein H0H87_006333 [Tephrocybe sp. NHM501043]|nr:hypothetical protein H0H87_006333 [Tephrocybe sp. NHM501043]